MRTYVRALVLFLLLLAAAIRGVAFTAASGLHASEGAPVYAADVERWRVERERDLKSDTGWLTVAGLVFLKPGVNTAGSAADSDVVLPAPAPAHAGRFVRNKTQVVFEPAANVSLLLNGQPLAGPITLGQRDRIASGAVTWQLHESGDRIGIRIRDANSALRRSFRGLRWFAVREAWKIDGRFVAYDAPRTITVPNVLGDYETLSVPGEVVFTAGGRELRLQAAQAGTRLWFIFSDALGGRETYHIRFLYADAPDASGQVTLDFNRAYNPPCAYNPFTTCPLPPPQNRLSVPVAAGEKKYSR